MQIVIATTNLHKVREFKELIKSVKGIELLSLHQFPDYVSPSAPGMSMADDAALKAAHAAKALQRWVIADDSGLIIPSLQQDSSAQKYRGSKATDPANRQELLQRLEGQTHLKRAAYYCCSQALASPEGLKKCVTATCEGLILPQEKGNKGNGFDSLFIKHDYDKSFGELEDMVRFRISHRSKAFEKLLPSLETLLRG